jgi:phosphoglycolate phosphatase-like HAD superfamily hydrolase
MRALALDFDGVISDSAPEAFRVAMQTYTELRPESAVSGFDQAALYERFLELMPLGNRAEDFAVVLAAVEAGAALPDQASYDAFYATLKTELLRAFHRRFYQVRADFARSRPDEWRRLLGPYPQLVEILRRRAGDTAFAIATAKDRDSVWQLLEHYGIAELFPRELVLDKETGRSKTAHLECLRDRLGIEYHDLTFVDDKVNHLDAVAPLGVRCALAAWGYNGPREHALARTRGYSVCQLEDVESQLFD